ncbi:MAG: hypothetical protein A3E93_02365 [Candidatus Zambryskibacteria bacterium RIFCSPHIGHO2_12_FULL_43_12b]|nr:MAG: hypothetical protein A3E93_02365 [Candidatus Zambryskibacteria bacterium RIFCSPHIGHO2_12_FULL_43_12b]
MDPFLVSILFVIFGQFLNAGIVLIDKYIVTRTSVSRPGVYAFYVAMISGVVIFLVPFGVVHIPTSQVIFLSLLGGFSFIASIILLFTALKSANATDVVAWLTVISTVTTFLFGYYFLSETLPQSFPYALALFVLGMALVGHFRFHAKSFIFVVFSGILFGLSAVLVKILFSHVGFIDGFFWSRMGNVVGALSLLFVPSIRHSIFQTSKQVSHKTSSLIILNRVLGGVAFLCILYAIRIGSVSVVNSLSSLQFVFIFLLVFLMAKQLPHLYEHEFRPGHILHKVISMILIGAGFIVLFL